MEITSQSVHESLNLSEKIQNITGLHILPFFIVALLWGSTDVLIAKASVQQKQDFAPLDFSPVNLIKFVVKKKIWIWMGINQIGSVLYAYLLGIYPVEYSLIWANCLTVFVSFVLQRAVHFYQQRSKKLDEKSQGNQDLLNKSESKRYEIQNFIGMSLILIGIYLMLV